MKDQMTIGQFSKKCGLSPRALRVYERIGLLTSQGRGENDYRYYTDVQLQQVRRIKELKAVGFRLREIKTLLSADQSLDFAKLESFFRARLRAVTDDEERARTQRQYLETIIPSLVKNNLKNKTRALDAPERRYIMSHFEKLSIVVTGIRDLETTARHIQAHLSMAGQKVPLRILDSNTTTLSQQPGIWVVHQSLLKNKNLQKLTPDVVVIKELSAFSPEIEADYMNLYSAAGPQMTTILNADDRASVALAANATIRKGKTYYFSKNSGLEPQIKNIGGLISDGDEIRVFGFNSQPKGLELKLDRILGIDDEVALLASVAAVMDIGLDEKNFSLSLT